MKTKTKKSVSRNNAIKIGGAIIGLTAIATAFFYGTKEGEKSRKIIKGWALKAKGEVLESLEDLKSVSEEKYHSALDKVVKKYKKISKISPQDLENFVKGMKKEWDILQKKTISKK